MLNAGEWPYAQQSETFCEYSTQQNDDGTVRFG